MTRRIEDEPAFVLHTRRYRETSLLLEIITQGYGRVGLVAKGARRAKSRLRGTLQPFQRLLVSWGERGELGTLIGAELVKGHVMPVGERLLSGLYINELLFRLCARGDPHPELFAAYARTLTALLAKGDIEPALRLFEKGVLEAIGYGLLLERTGDNDEPITAGETYVYYPENGPVHYPGHRDPSSMEYPVVGGDTLLALAQESPMTELQLLEAKRLMRRILAQYLGNRPVASRELLRSLPGRQLH